MNAWLPSLWLLGATGLWCYRDPLPLRITGFEGRALPGVLFAAPLTVGLLISALTLPAGLARAHSGTLAWVSLVLWIPLAEELFFRGLLYCHLARRLGPWPATGLVSLAFGLLHSPQGTFWAMLVLSLVLCMVTRLTQGLLWAMALHAAWNALSVLLTWPEGPSRLALVGLAVAPLWLGVALHAIAAPGPRVTAEGQRFEDG